VAKQTIRICDKCQEPATQTEQFDYDGHSYAIDLCTQHCEILAHAQSTLADMVVHAVKLSRRRSRARWEQENGKTTEDYVKIRAWAKDNGVLVAEQGRIPRTVIEAYHQATDQQPTGDE
jgi:hypothetical protein